MTHIVCDAMNFLHRCRIGAQGPFALQFNAHRNLRSQLDKLGATSCDFVFEGKARERIALDASYKANRDISKKSEAERSTLHDFFAAVEDLKPSLLSLPITICANPSFEADDVIAALAIQRATETEDDVIVVSNDSDFTQLVGKYDQLRVWNPRAKEFLSAPDYDYVTWKSLRGDGSDNVPAVDKCGDKLAEKLSSDMDALSEWLDEKDGRWERYAINRILIEFACVDDVLTGTLASVGSWNLAALKSEFLRWKAFSLLTGVALDRFEQTYGKMKTDTVITTSHSGSAAFLANNCHGRLFLGSPECDVVMINYA